MKLKAFFSIFMLSALLISCNDDDDNPSPKVTSVLVINEGNFQSGDGSITLFNSENNEVTQNAYESENQDPIGATVQRLVEHNGDIYMVTNFPDRLEKLNATTLERKSSIEQGFNNPYAFAAVGNKGYVSNWGDLNFETFVYENSYISVIDLESMEIIETISRSKQPQDLVVVGDQLYVTDVSANTISVIDTETDTELTAVNGPSFPDRMVVDADNQIWVLCRSGSLARINTLTNLIDETYTELPVSGFNEKMVIDESSQTLYWLSSVGFNPSVSGIYKFDISANEPSENPLVTGENWYGLGVNDEELYVGDANAFQSNGTVIRYTIEGETIDNFPAGRGPNGFLFLK